MYCRNTRATKEDLIKQLLFWFVLLFFANALLVSCTIGGGAQVALQAPILPGVSFSTPATTTSTALSALPLRSVVDTRCLTDREYHWYDSCVGLPCACACDDDDDGGGYFCAQQNPNVPKHGDSLIIKSLLIISRKFTAFSVYRTRYTYHYTPHILVHVYSKIPMREYPV